MDKITLKMMLLLFILSISYTPSAEAGDNVPFKCPTRLDEIVDAVFVPHMQQTYKQYATNADFNFRLVYLFDIVFGKECYGPDRPPECGDLTYRGWREDFKRFRDLENIEELTCIDKLVDKVIEQRKEKK